MFQMDKQSPQRGDGVVFEITDYTTASDWERFIANIEEILSDWGLDKQTTQNEPHLELPEGFISKGVWHEKHDIVRYGNVNFDIRYQYLNDSVLRSKKNSLKGGLVETNGSSFDAADEYQEADQQEANSSSSPADDTTTTNDPQEEEEKKHGEHELPQNAPECIRDLVSSSNDFASKAHCLVRWYNLRKFIILSPRGDTIIYEDRLKLVLSSASIALANIDCHVPIFVQIFNPKNHFYHGISEHSNIRAMYDMVFFKKSLRQYSYLSELIGMFREKTGCYLSDPITATIRLNYCLDVFDLFVPSIEEFSGTEYASDDQDDLVKMTMERKKEKPKRARVQDMRSGATFEQVVEALDDCLPHPYKILKFIHVAALWPPVSDKMITDSAVHSDLDPAEAPIWTMRCVTSDNCNMKIVHECQVVYELLCGAVDYAYDKMDADVAFTDYTRETLKERCLKLSYDLATQSEVLLSENTSDSIRKLVALLFYRADEITANHEALDQIAMQLKKRPSFSELYRTFARKHKPSIKEFILRTQISRPFNPVDTPALPQRMFCTICDEEFRLCGAFSELCN